MDSVYSSTPMVSYLLGGSVMACITVPPSGREFRLESEQLFKTRDVNTLRFS